MRTISHSTRFRQMNQEVYNKLTNAFQNTCRIAGLFAVFHHNTFTLLYIRVYVRTEVIYEHHTHANMQTHTYIHRHTHV